jgi:hypothetical protein
MYKLPHSAFSADAGIAFKAAVSSHSAVDPKAALPVLVTLLSHSSLHLSSIYPRGTFSLKAKTS